MGGGQSSQSTAAGESPNAVKKDHPGADGDVVILPVDQSKQAEAAFECRLIKLLFGPVIGPNFPKFCD